MTIKVFYSSIDGVRKTRSFKSLKGARKYAQERVGKNPDMGSSYAVSDDGVGKISVDGVALAALFGDDPAEYFVIRDDGAGDVSRQEVLFSSASLDGAKADARQRKEYGEGERFLVVRPVWSTQDDGATS